MQPPVIIILVSVFAVVFILQVFTFKSFLKHRREELNKK